MQMYITKNGSKPSASYFKRDYCGSIMNQKVPKKFEDLSKKMSSSQIRRIQQEQIFVEIAGKTGFFAS